MCVRAWLWRCGDIVLCRANDHFITFSCEKVTKQTSACKLLLFITIVLYHSARPLRTCPVWHCTVSNILRRRDVSCACNCADTHNTDFLLNRNTAMLVPVFDSKNRYVGVNRSKGDGNLFHQVGHPHSHKRLFASHGKNRYIYITLRRYVLHLGIYYYLGIYHPTTILIACASFFLMVPAYFAILPMSKI